MDDTTSTAPETAGLAAIIATLEHQLAALDALGLSVGAAHLDAAIQHLRLEQLRHKLG